MQNENDKQEFQRKLEALAFCRCNDAVKLAFLGEDALTRIDALDLSALAEFHRLSNGTVELKFLDRVKLLELLERTGLLSAADGAEELACAIRSAADRLSPDLAEPAEDDDALS